LEAGAFALRQYLARGNEADFHCLRLDDHARDMAFDQLAGTLDRWVKRSSQPPLRTDAELVRMRRAHAWRWARRRRACWQACADAGGNRMTPAHATKKAERYRYYVSAPLLADDRPLAQKGMRVPAGDMEGLVLDRLIIRALFSSRIGVSDAIAPLDLDARALDAAQFSGKSFRLDPRQSFSKRR
jgi:hypothetical protein